MPCFLAKPRVDQWVASGGADSKVSTRTASITSSPTVRAAPGRGASVSPSSRSAAKRCRHLDTVTGCTLSSAATSVRAPSAEASTMRDRSASAWAEVWRRAQRCSVSRSLSVRVTGWWAGQGVPCRAPSVRFYLAERAPARINSLFGYFLSGTV